MRTYATIIGIPVGSVFVWWPKCVNRCAQTANLFRECAIKLCSVSNLVNQELKNWYSTDVDFFLREITVQLKGGSRCCSFSCGSCGWSGDNSMRQGCFTDFVGIRRDLLASPDCLKTQFTIRHELQHEIQQFRDGEFKRGLYRIVTTLAGFEIGLFRRWFKQYKLETDANHAASDYARAVGILKPWNPYAWSWFLNILALFCTFGILEKAGLYTVISLVVIFLSKQFPTMAPVVYLSLVAVCLLTLLKK